MSFMAKKTKHTDPEMKPKTKEENFIEELKIKIRQQKQALTKIIKKFSKEENES